jgi:hypothetical protein
LQILESPSLAASHSTQDNHLTKTGICALQQNSIRPELFNIAVLPREFPATTESRTVFCVCGYRTSGMASYGISDRAANCTEGFTIMRVAENVRSTHNQDGGIVLDILHGQMFRLNFVGSRILQLLNQGCAEPEIAAQLARDFGVERAKAETDVREFVDTLEKHHLLTVRNGNPLG